MKTRSPFLTTLTSGTLLAFAVPAGVFLCCALVAGLSVFDSLRATGAQFAAERHPLLGAAILGMAPVLFQAALVWLLARRMPAERVHTLALAGLFAIVLVLLWVNLEFWPGYLPDKALRGFPHGLEFVIGPLFFAPPATLLAMGAAWIATRKAAP